MDIIIYTAKSKWIENEADGLRRSKLEVLLKEDPKAVVKAACEPGRHCVLYPIDDGDKDAERHLKAWRSEMPRDTLILVTQESTLKSGRLERLATAGADAFLPDALNSERSVAFLTALLSEKELDAEASSKGFKGLAGDTLKLLSKLWSTSPKRPPSDSHKGKGRLTHFQQQEQKAELSKNPFNRSKRKQSLRLVGDVLVSTESYLFAPALAATMPDKLSKFENRRSWNAAVSGRIWNKLRSTFNRPQTPSKLEGVEQSASQPSLSMPEEQSVSARLEKTDPRDGAETVGEAYGEMDPSKNSEPESKKQSQKLRQQSVQPKQHLPGVYSGACFVDPISHPKGLRLSALNVDITLFPQHVLLPDATLQGRLLSRQLHVKRDTCLEDFAGIEVMSVIGEACLGLNENKVMKESGILGKAAPAASQVPLIAGGITAKHRYAGSAPRVKGPEAQRSPEAKVNVAVNAIMDVDLSSKASVLPSLEGQLPELFDQKSRLLQTKRFSSIGGSRLNMPLLFQKKRDHKPISLPLKLLSPSEEAEPTPARDERYHQYSVKPPSASKQHPNDALDAERESIPEQAASVLPSLTPLAVENESELESWQPLAQPSLLLSPPSMKQDTQIESVDDALMAWRNISQKPGPEGASKIDGLHVNPLVTASSAPVSGSTRMPSKLGIAPPDRMTLRDRGIWASVGLYRKPSEMLAQIEVKPFVAPPPVAVAEAEPLPSVDAAGFVGEVVAFEDGSEATIIEEREDAVLLKGESFEEWIPKAELF